MSRDPQPTPPPLPRSGTRSDRLNPPRVKNASNGKGQLVLENEGSQRKGLAGLIGGMSLGQSEAFCKRFATGLRSGVDVLRLLEMEGKYGSARHRSMVEEVGLKVRGGETLARAMQQSGPYFPNLLVRIVGTGEHSGRVEYVFHVMAEHYSQLKRARSTFVSQITFPLISLGIAFFVISLLIYVNGFMQAGSMNDKPFDLTGLGLRGASGVAIFWMFAAAASFFAAVAILGVWKNWFNCHATLVPLVRNVPVIGPVVTNSALARLSMTLSMMLGAGVDARRSVREALLSTANHYYMRGIRDVETAIGQGQSFSDALAIPGTLPEEFIQTVEVGEISGNDSESLERMADIYREKANGALKQLAIVAGMAVWLMIALIVIVAIFTIFFQVMQVYSDALKM